MLVPYLVFLEPLGAGMVEIKKEMCAGNQTFVVADNPEVQEIIGYRTQAFNGQDAAMWLQVFESQVFFFNENFGAWVYGQIGGKCTLMNRIQ